MRNFDTTSRMDRDDEARRANQEGLFEDPAFADVARIAYQVSLNEDRFDSEANANELRVMNALNALSVYDEAIKRDIDTSSTAYRPGRTPGVQLSYEQKKKLLINADENIRNLQKTANNPNLKTFTQILAETAKVARKERESASALATNARGLASAGAFMGRAAALATDPAVLATLPIGAGTITGGTIAANALKAFAVESLIAGASEVAIQGQVINWKKQINSPYSFGEAAFNVLTTMAAAGLIRATGSAIVDVVQIRKAAAIKRAQPGKLSQSEADILEQYANDIETAKATSTTPEVDPVKEHFDNLDKALDDLDRGQTTSAGKPAERVEEIDPLTVTVDAEQFQFKAGTDAAGVSDRLKGVARWDPKFAGIAIVYENRTGARFIVDGHQRVGLAKRLIEAGQDPAEVRLNAIVLREADGVSVADARQMAAAKNIAEGTGSAVDTAKIFRELGDSGLDLMPSLPPNSALVRAGRGLSNLDNDAFSMVINGVVDEKIGAIVGELVTDAAEQRAIITALAQAEPANLTQARIMINDMKAAGFQRVETEDLFGGQVVAESLFKERARILENATKLLRQDKATFKTLERKAGEIASEGNQLNREANQARITSDEQTLAELTRLANTKGPISDALNESASGLKGGKSINASTEDFLGAIKRSKSEKPGAGPGASGAGPAEQAIEFKKGAPSDSLTVTAGRASQSNQPVTSESKNALSMQQSIAQSDIGKATKDPVLDLFGEDTRAAQAIHDARLEIERALNPDDVVPVEAGPGDLFSGKSRQIELEDEVDRLVYERDLDVPEGLSVDVDGNITHTTRGAREIYDEIDTAARAVADLEGCLLG